MKIPGVINKRERGGNEGEDGGIVGLCDSCFFLGGGWEVTHPPTSPTTTAPSPCRPPSCLGYSPCAGLRALGMNGARAALRL